MNTESAAETDPRVLLITPGWPADSIPNGIAAYVANLRRVLSARGQSPGVLSLSKLRNAAAGDQAWSVPELVRPEGLPYRLARGLARLTHRRALPGADIGLAARRLRARWPYDLLEVEESFGFSLGIQKAVPVPVIVRLHGPWFLAGAALRLPQDEAFANKVRMEGQSIARADAVTACSDYVLDEVRSYYGLPLEEARVIPNPGPEVAEEQIWRPDSSDPNHVLFVGRFDSFKGGDIALGAMARILRQRGNLRFTFAGPDRGFTDERGRVWKAEEFLRHVAPEAGIRERVTFTGALPRSSIDRLRASAQVTIVTSRFETYCLAAAELLAHGCPGVLSTAVPLPQIVRHEHNCLVFESGDAEGLQRQVERLLDDPDLCSRLGRAARTDYLEKLGPDAIAAETMAMYRDVATRGRH